MTPAPSCAWHAGELAYCSNVHPGEDLEAIEHNLARYLAPVRESRGLAAQGAGLWLSHAVARALDASPAALEQLRARLDDHRIRLFTLNGFPYGGFHERAVKARVYSPDWSTPERCDYTLALARILSVCLPEDAAEGTISTLPLGYAGDWSPDRQRQAAERLCNLAARLHALGEHSGRHIRVCLEMEPGCVLETSAEAVDFFSRDLPAAAERTATPPQFLTEHLGICYDVCHQAVMFEAADESLARLQAAGIVVGKIQISSALEVPQPASAAMQHLLGDFVEPRYLHQVRCRDADGRLHGVMDLPDSLADDDFPRGGPWRIHFHVPVHAAELCAGGLATTQSQIGSVLDYLATQPGMRPHLEIETYTWQVLPEALRPGTDTELIEGLCAELGWLEAALNARGLLQ